MKSTKVIFLLLVMFCINSLAYGEYRQVCKAKYMRQSGWSEYYTVEVNFLTGSELNKATQSFDYDGFATYGVIFWDEGEASVIKISSFLSCGMEVTERCITGAILNLDGKDQQGVKWEICKKNMCY